MKILIFNFSLISFPPDLLTKISLRSVLKKQYLRYSHLDSAADRGVSAGLGPRGEAELAAGAPPAPLGVEGAVPLHLRLGLPAQPPPLPDDVEVSAPAPVRVTAPLHPHHCRPANLRVSTIVNSN